MTIKTMEAAWDPLGKVWYVARSDIPGLAAEGATYEELMDRVKLVVPGFVTLTRVDDEDDVVNLRFWTDQKVV
jgi:predicted RNase H-like HicB family nuclease